MGWLKNLIVKIVKEVLANSEISVDKKGNASIKYKKEI